MCRGGLHGIDGAQPLGNEGRRSAQVRRLDDDELIIAPAHEVAALNFLKFGNPRGYTIKATIAFGRDFDLDNSRDLFRAPFFPVDDWLIAKNDVVRF